MMKPTLTIYPILCLWAISLWISGCNGGSSSTVHELTDATIMSTTGEVIVESQEQYYDGIILDSTFTVAMHWRRKIDDIDSGYRTIGAVKNEMGKVRDIHMITNGGMFSPTYAPIGLYIDNYRVLVPINTNTTGYGNFHLQPNGVFYIDSLGWHISTTQEYLANINSHIQYATQSGPMLVVDSMINPAFNTQSQNRRLRSGVGSMPDGKCVFLISRSDVTFYEFAALFRNRFKCKAALFLDGEVSRMYTKTWRDWDTLGAFGVMISVARKNSEL